MGCGLAEVGTECFNQASPASMSPSRAAYFSAVVLATAIFTGCASISMLPQDASAVDFGGAEGKTGWSQYEQVEQFDGYSPAQVYAAAKIGLGNAGFSLRRADTAKGMVIGEHGMTAHDWNVIAGVYFREADDGTLVKVIVEGSKDIGFSGDVTSDGWSGKIIKGMHEYLNEKHTAVLRVDKADLK